MQMHPLPVSKHRSQKYSHCKSSGADLKQTIIYDLELAAVLALDFWAVILQSGLEVCFGDNDGVRSSTRFCNSGCRAALMWLSCSPVVQLRRRAHNNFSTWFARVPTEANTSDYPSRQCDHPLRSSDLNQTEEAHPFFPKLVEVASLATRGKLESPRGVLRPVCHVDKIICAAAIMERLR